MLVMDSGSVCLESEETTVRFKLGGRFNLERHFEGRLVVGALKVV